MRSTSSLSGAVRVAMGSAALMILSGAVTLTYSPHAFAQRSASEVGESIEEIIVTAQKRSEDIQRVPISMSVLQGEQLQALNATQLQDYIAYVPGVVVESGGGPGLATISIRGLNPFVVGTTLVATYIDDAPVGSSGAWAQESQYSLDLMPYDVERIEILRGPQGTLYGANSMGGLLKYITRAPQLTDFEARVGGDFFDNSGGGDSGWGGRIGINAPLIADKLAARVSAYKHETPGYIDNPVRGSRDENSADQYGGRVAVLWQPSSSFSVSASALIQRIDSEGLGLAQRAADGTTLPAGELSYSHPIAEPFFRDLRYYSATLQWDLAWATAVSATSYSESTIRQTSDFSPTFGSLIPLFTGGAVATGTSDFAREMKIRRVTEELRLVSPSGTRFEWLIGAYYSDEDTGNLQDLSAKDGSQQPVVGLDPLVLADQPATYEEIAAFANTTFKITDRFDVSTGLRWASNEQGFVQNLGGALLAPGITPGASEEEVVTYAVSPRFQVSDGAMLYLRAATGYRPGGPNVALPGVPRQVDSDSTRNYEAGAKLTLLDSRALVNAAVFQTDWDDMQILVSDPNGIQFFANANSARTRGVELTTAFAPSEDFRLTVNAAYLDAKLTADVPELGWTDGSRMPAAPKWTASATADYSRPLGAEWKAGSGIGVRYVSKRLNGVANTDPPPLELSAYSPVDLYLRLANTSWTINVYARNVFDQRRFTNETVLQDLLGQSPAFRQGSVLEPRTVGVSIDVTF